MALVRNMGPNPLNISKEAIAGGGAANLASKITWPVQDAVHLLHSTDAVRTGATASHAVGGASAIGSSITTALSGVLGIAAGTGFSAYMNHLVHGHHEDEITERYRPQLASITAKDESSVNNADLYRVAANNPGLDEELDRNRGMRNLRTASTLAATTLAFAAVFTAVALVPPLGALGAAAAAGGVFSGAGLGFIGATMAISYGVLHTAGKGLTKLSAKMFGYDKPNTEDHVHGLADMVNDGKAVSPEKVMGVYVAASPALQEEIQCTFGDRYDRLSTADQVKAEKMYGDNLPLEEATHAINNGQMNPRELMFAVSGQVSGAGGSILLAPSSGQGAAPQQAVEKSVSPQQPQPPQQKKSQNAAPITANQWQDLVEKQRSEQPGQIITR